MGRWGGETIGPWPGPTTARKRRGVEREAGRASFGFGPKERGRERGKKKPFYFYIFINLLQIATNFKFKATQL
jgi:hypothetical protein